MRNGHHKFVIVPHTIFPGPIVPGPIIPGLPASKGVIPCLMAARRRRLRGNEVEFERLLEAMRPEGALRQQIVAARLRAGLSQAALARRMGTGQSAIAWLESGKASPSFTTLRRLAEATGARLSVKLEGGSSN